MFVHFLCYLELNGRRHRSSSPLDPLLAGLLSVFIVTTAVVFVILFLKFRQRTNHPEFHRLQDLPMVRYLHVLQCRKDGIKGALFKHEGQFTCLEEHYSAI